MDWFSLLVIVAPPVLTFLVGLALKSPIYQKGKGVLKAVSDALVDDKVTADELQRILDAFKK